MCAGNHEIVKERTFKLLLNYFVMDQLEDDYVNYRDMTQQAGLAVMF
jgi:hypothetical protein